MRLLVLMLLVIVGLTACNDTAPTEEETAPFQESGDSGIDQLSAQIAAEPQNARLYANRASMYYEKNSYDQAIQDMTVALTLDSTNLAFHHLLSDIYVDYFRSRLALQTMERAVSLYPDDIPSLLKLAELQLILKQNSASFSSIDKALKLDPQEPAAFTLMGKNFEEMGDTIRAINSYQEAVELEPELVDVWIKLGQLHASIDGSLAGDFFDNAIEVDSASTTAINAKAEYLWSQDDPQGALSLYERAIRANPMDEKGYYNAGLVHMEMDSLEKAYQHFNMAIENSPLYVGAYFFRGYAAELMGRTTDARKDYEHALRLAPDYTDAREGLNRLPAE